MRVLVTGGAGYIGSHTLLQLLRARHEVLVFDNFSNSSREALARVKQLANADFEITEGSVETGPALETAMASFRPEAVVHFAGLKAVSTSNTQPLDYYAQNVFGSIGLLRAMDAVNCQRLVFSSSATVYGVPHYLPYDEAHPLTPTSPYGRTKRMVEDIIRDWCAAKPNSAAAILRYFNPVGADASGRIGEDPTGVPDNLVPFIAQVAVGRRAELSVFGNDYDTADGTAERDYIHVEDLATAHLAALTYLEATKGCEEINIGTGHSTSVLNMIQAFERASGRPIPYKIAPRRAGDVAQMRADPSKAAKLLGWHAQHDIDAMCASSWHWQSNNPEGYPD